MHGQWKSGAAAACVGLSVLAPMCAAQSAAATKPAQPTSPQYVTEAVTPVFGGVLLPVGKRAPSAPVLRGTSLLYDTITGCTMFSRLTAGPAALFDDGSFTPGVAQVNGGTVREIDFFVRPLVPLPTIVARITIYDTVTIPGVGSPLIVQADQIFSETYVITGTVANTTPGLYQFTADVADFMIDNDNWGIEVAFLDAVGGNILPNGQVTTSFPAAVCEPTQPAVGSSQAIWWADNDFGDITGDGIRYEPYDASQANVDQGDAIAWAAGGPENSLGYRLRGTPNDPTMGACCDTATLGCRLSTPEDCNGVNEVFTGLGNPCATFACVAPPANDECATAHVIDTFGQIAYDNRGATDSPEPDPTGCVPPQPQGEDVWFRWQSECNGPVTVSTCLLTLTDDLIAVYSGSCGALTEVGCDDDGCGVVGGSSTVTFNASSGTTYFFRIGTWNSTPGGENFFDFIDGGCTPGGGSCDADWCNDGVVGVPDIFCFLSAWFALDPAARNYGGTPGVPAIFAFLSIWFSTGVGPCP